MLNEGVASAASWRWADLSGEQYDIPYRELWEALSSGSLPPYVLVWRPGFREWMHAQNVAELADALGVDRAAPPSVVFPDPDAKSPPEPPLERYAKVAPRNAETLRRSVGPSVNPKVPAFVEAARAAHDHRSPPAVPTPPPMANVPIPVRDVMPTLAEVEQPTRTTLRPAGAMPPPPRGMPARAAVSSVDDEADVSLGPAPRHAPPPLPEAPMDQGPRRERPSAALGGLTRRTVSTITAVGLVLPGLTLLAFALTHDRPGAKKAELAASAAPSALSAPPPLAGCVVDNPARRLAESAYVSVPLIVATTPDGSHAAVGLATAKDRALGIAVEPASLSVEQVFQEAVPDTAILGVVPLVRSGRLEFAVDPPQSTLSFTRTIDAPKRFSIGVSNDGLSRAVGSSVDVIWPGKSDKPTITTPRVGSASGIGHVVTFRHGGQDGKILVGWLNDDGTKRTELKAVGTEATLVGTPAVSVDEQAALLAFSAKKEASDPWHVELSRFIPGELPERGTPIAIPRGGPGGEAISPSVEVLDRGRFLLQWTEGAAGNRAVRAEVLARDLVPIGEAITLSTPDQNAGQGALWVRGPRGLALFLVKKETSHELWGAALRCR